jgi:hemin uptake protein HemP
MKQPFGKSPLPASAEPQALEAGETRVTSQLEVVPAPVLFGRRRELVIEHAGCLYRLRITRNNKLILTK